MLPFLLLFPRNLEHSLSWVVDIGASWHYSCVVSDFIGLTLRDDLDDTISGISCPIRGVGNILVTIVDSVSDYVSFTLLDVLYILDLAQRFGRAYLRILSVRLAVGVSLNYTFTTTNDFISHPSGLTVDLVRHHSLT